MANIRDVAKKAGVALGTVSNVINEDPKVSDATRERVLAAMHELNYIPNQLARAMFKQESGIVAMLVPSIKHPFFASVAEEIEKMLFKKGKRLMLCGTGSYESVEKDYIDFFRTNIVDAVIVAVTNKNTDIYKDFTKPIIMLDFEMDEETPLVVTDHAEGGRLAAEELYRCGVKKALHLTGYEVDERYVSQRGHDSFRNYLIEHGVEVVEIPAYWTAYGDAVYVKYAEEVLTSRPDIDGVMAPDLLAVAFFNAASKIGRKIPEELKIVSFDGTYIADFTQEKMTVIKQPINDIARETIDLIEKLTTGIPPKSVKIYLSPTIELGKSTRK